jgi:hypothetical protein
MKSNLSFILCLIATLGLLGLAWFKGVEIDTALIAVVTAYVLGRGATKASHVWAASKDPNADTKAAIDNLEGK